MYLMFRRYPVQSQTARNVATRPCNIQIFKSCKNRTFSLGSKIGSEIFSRKILIFFLFLLKTDCGYTLEPPRRSGSNEYPQSMFLSKNKKNRFTPYIPQFLLYESGV